MATFTRDQTRQWEPFWICVACTYQNADLEAECCASCGANKLTAARQAPFVWHCLFCSQLNVKSREESTALLANSNNRIDTCGDCLLTRVSWTCPRCGVEYSPAVHACSVCTEAGNQLNRPVDLRGGQSYRERSPGSRFVPSRPAPPLPPAAAAGSWTCTMCSFTNYKADATACEVCMYPRSSSVQSQLSSSSSWTCARCTFINPNSNGQCDVCGNARPSTIRNDDDQNRSSTTTSSPSPSSRPSSSNHNRVTSIKPQQGWLCDVCGRRHATDSVVATYCSNCGSHRCAECGRAIPPSSPYLQLSATGSPGPARFIHQDCLRCTGCQQRIAPGEPYVVAGTADDRYHCRCHEQIFSIHCRVCEQQITGARYLKDPYWEDAYCEAHDERGRPLFRCLGCQRIWPDSRAPIEMIKLGHADHFICPLCAQDAVLGPSPQELERIRSRIASFFGVLGLDIPQRNIPVRVVEPDVMLASSSTRRGGGRAAQSHTLGKCETVVDEVFMAGRRISATARVERISMMNGLPLVVFEDVLSHEMMHAYLRLNGFPVSLDPAVEEGLCQLMSFLWLENGDDDGFAISSETGLAAEASQQRTGHQAKVRQLRKMMLERGEDPIYGEGFRRCYTAFLQAGCLDPLLNHVKQHGTLPPID